MLGFVFKTGIDASTGSVSTVTLPLVITSSIFIVDPTATLYSSCSSTPITTIPSSQPQPSPTPTIVVVTTTPAPTVVTAVQTSSLRNGGVSLYTITTTSTLPPTIVFQSTLAGASQSQTSKSSSNIGPIAGGAAGGFIFLLVVVAMTWYSLCVRVACSWAKSLISMLARKKCRRPQAAREEEEVVFPYPVTRDRDQNRRLDLNKESRPYAYGHVGRPSSVPGSSPSPSHDGRPDSATALIGASGLTPMTSASGNIATIHGTLDEVGRQPSYNSTLPLGAAPPDHYSHSAGSISGGSLNGAPPASRPLQVTNSSLPPMPPLSGSSSGAVLGPVPLTVQESTWPEKNPDRGLLSSSGAILSNDDQFQGPDGRPSGSGPGGVLQGTSSARPGPTTGDPTDAPPAYVA